MEVFRLRSVMPVLRKLPVWIVLASYLFANTVASSLHDHRDCCSHSDGAHHDAPGCAVPHRHLTGGKQCCHHGHSHHHHSARNQKASHAPVEGQKGDDQRAPRQCVVCDFLTLAPLPAPPTALDSTGEVLPEFVVLDVLPVSSTTVETHLARGPPAV